MNITLPYPPSVNHYWRNVNGRTLISRKGREYRDAVADVVVAEACRRNVAAPHGERLAVRIVANAPDKRRRDLDNVCKALLDALCYAGVYEDDSLIDDLRVIRGIPGMGDVLVTIEPIVRVL